MTIRLDSRKFRVVAAISLIGLTAVSAFLWRSKNSPANAASQLRPDEWFYMQRLYPESTFAIKSYTAALQDAIQRSAEKNFDGFDLPWTVRGPANIGARINAVAVDPTQEDIMYAGFAVGGLYKTTNGGQDWIPVFDDQPFLAIGAIAIDPQNTNVVYAGTGDPNISAYPFLGNGIYKSSDGGATWQHLGLTNQRIVSRIAVHPANSQIIYAACMGLPFERNNDRGLYKSVDGGQSWQQILFVSNQSGVIDLVMDPTQPDVLYAASWDRIRNNSESMVSGPNARIFKTTNGGESWIQLTNGLPTGNMGRIGLAISPSQPNIVYAQYVGTNSQVFNVFRTTDSGASWQPTMPQDQVNDILPGVLGGFGWYFGKIRVNPNDPNDVFLLGVDLWRSPDGGASWLEASPPWWEYSVHADKHDLQFTPSGVILLATDGGLYKSSDNTQSWSDIERIPTNQVYRVAYNPHEPGWCYGGLQDNGCAGGPDLTTDWLRIYGGDGFQMVFHPENPLIVYAESQNGNIGVSTDGGNSWNEGDTGIDDGDRTHWDSPYFISSHDPNVMYTGTYRVYKNLDSANPNWFPISEDLTDGIVFSPNFHTITTITESPRVQGLLYVGTTDGNVWRTDDDGAGWTPIYANLPNRYVTNVEASPSFENTVYVSHSGYKDNDFTPRIHRSDDRGNTWASISANLPNLAVNDLLVLPGHQDTVLFAATDGGIYGTKNGGQAWARLGNNMPMVPVFHLTWNETHNELIAGTHGRSIMSYPLDSLFVIPDTVVTSTETIGAYAANKLSVHPSPASHSAVVSWENTQQACKQIWVYNAAGEIVYRQQGRSNTNSIQLDVSTWKPGVYYTVVLFETNTRRSTAFVVLH